MKRELRPYLFQLLFATLISSSLHAGETAVGPDVITGEINNIARWGSIGGITAYSMGYTVCNIGDENVVMIMTGPDHPVFTENIYRYSFDGRFEQTGMLWVQHTFCALQQLLCGDCPGAGGCLPYIAPLCSDPHGHTTAGLQSSMGPRWQVNAFTGQFPYPPVSGGGGPFEVIDRRIQLRITDIDPELNPGAIYFGDTIFVAGDDAAAGNQYNNASYKRVEFGSAPIFSATTIEPIFQMQHALDAWQSVDSEVVVVEVQVPNEGRFYVGYKVDELEGGLWHYEYAIYNYNSTRAARSLTIPIGDCVTLTEVGFHDVHYHSGDGVGGVNVDGTDWLVTEEIGAITWQTQTFAENPNANALRWATLYNFRFDADAPPVETTATLGLFVPMDPMEVEFPLLAPGDLDGSCAVDLDDSGEVGFADLLILLGSWGEVDAEADLDGSGVGFSDLLVVLDAWGPCP